MTDLHFNSAASVTGWTPIDDRVMGGVSSSQLVFHQDGYAVFAGQVSSDHGGGLASVRHCDLGLGDGNTVGYRLQVRNDSTRLFDARWAFFLGFFDMPKVERIPLHTSSRLAELSGVAGALDKDGYLLQTQP